MQSRKEGENSKFYTWEMLHKKLIILSVYRLTIIKIRLKSNQSINSFETRKTQFSERFGPPT